MFKKKEQLQINQLKDQFVYNTVSTHWILLFNSRQTNNEDEIFYYHSQYQ